MVGIFLLSGCGSKILSKEDAYPKMYSERPVSILVVPAINESSAADAPDLYSSTINEPLSNAGFYVLPIEVTNNFLRNEGLTDGAQIKNVPPQKFAEIFGADAVFYATIKSWDTDYYVVAGSVKVGIQYELVSCITGETLWRNEKEITVDTSSGADGYLGVVLTALETATQDYVPIARDVNIQALNYIPLGKYNRNYDLDRTTPAGIELPKGSFLPETIPFPL